MGILSVSGSLAGGNCPCGIALGTEGLRPGESGDPALAA